MVGGEQLQITDVIVKLFARLKDCTLYNHYGPSETHVVTSFTLPRDPETWPVFPLLGRPITNTEMYLLDSYLHLVPVGVPGELYIGGACLAHGYLNRPALTAERFIPHPFSSEPGARLYKTGDLARYQKNGNIEFIGRNDFQVKIRGMRIELGEIEATLRQHETVNEAVVTLRQDPSGEKRLVAYVIANPGCTIEARQLRDYLRGKLPEYMLPAAFVALTSFPLTVSGKINRLALPAPETNLETEEGYIAPRGALEEVLATIFAEVLKLERIGVRDNFFDLGGHSLSATQIVSRVREAFRRNCRCARFLSSRPLRVWRKRCSKSMVSRSSAPPSCCCKSLRSPMKRRVKSGFRRQRRARRRSQTLEVSSSRRERQANAACDQDCSAFFCAATTMVS